MTRRHSHTAVRLTMAQRPPLAHFGFVCLTSLCLLCFASTLCGQVIGKYDPNKPPDLIAVDPEIRTLLDGSNVDCQRFNIEDRIQELRKAVGVASERGLIRDRALAEATLASAYIWKGTLDAAFEDF